MDSNQNIPGEPIQTGLTNTRRLPDDTVHEPEIILERVPAGLRRPSWLQMGLALAVAGASDVLSLYIDLVMPLQWALDVATAILLFMILGRRWAILPGLIAEAVPGVGIFPVWVLVVISIILYNDIKKRKT